ncbi:MAG: preprotein translocase subunit YajC [Betaproteobacteria bacterium]|nr:MAG: preprotein translocase subunit YajC [Betaproteobacteria bacterium]
MAKILLVIAVFAAVYFVVRAYARAVTRGREEPRVKGDEDMVRCRHCGVHLPRSESLGTGEAWFCSEEHRRLHGS